METFTYDELRMMRDALNEWSGRPDENLGKLYDLMDKLDRMIRSIQNSPSMNDLLGPR